MHVAADQESWWKTANPNVQWLLLLGTLGQLRAAALFCVSGEAVPGQGRPSGRTAVVFGASGFVVCVMLMGTRAAWRNSTSGRS